MHRGVTFPKAVHCEYGKVPVYILYFTHILIDCPRCDDNNFLEIINIFFLPFMHVFCPGVGLSDGPSLMVVDCSG